MFYLVSYKVMGKPWIHYFAISRILNAARVHSEQFCCELFLIVNAFWDPVNVFTNFRNLFSDSSSWLLKQCRELMKNVPALCKRNKKFLKKWMHSSDLVYCPVPLVIPFRLSYKQPLIKIVFLFVFCCPTVFYKFTQKPNRVAVCLWCSIYVYASMRITP